METFKDLREKEIEKYYFLQVNADVKPERAHDSDDIPEDMRHYHEVFYFGKGGREVSLWIDNPYRWATMQKYGFKSPNRAEKLIADLESGKAEDANFLHWDRYDFTFSIREVKSSDYE